MKGQVEIPKICFNIQGLQPQTCKKTVNWAETLLVRDFFGPELANMRLGVSQYLRN